MKMILPHLKLFLTVQLAALVWEFGYRDSSTILVEASEIDNNNNIQTEETLTNEFEFILQDIDIKGSSSQLFIDDENIIHNLTIEAEQSVNISSYSVMNLANKTYTIKHTKNNSYESTFKIDILSNRIQKAHSGSVKLFRGILSDRKLTKVSSVKVQQTFKQKLALATINNSISATLSNGKIVVTVTP